MKKGDTAYMKNVGFGLTSFERWKVEKVSNGKVYIDGLDYPFDAKTGQQISDLPSLGLTVSLCVADRDIERAQKYCADDLQ